MTKEKTGTLSTRLPVKLIEKIEEISTKEGLDRNTIVRNILEKSLKNITKNNYISTHKKLDKILKKIENLS